MNAPALILLTAGAVLGGLAFVGRTTEELGEDYTEMQGPPSPSKDYPGKPMIAPLGAEPRLPEGITPLPSKAPKKPTRSKRKSDR